VILGPLGELASDRLVEVDVERGHHAAQHRVGAAEEQQLHNLAIAKPLSNRLEVGVGRARRSQLAQRGADVHGRSTDRGRQVVADINDRGQAARFIAADLTEPAEVERLADEAGDVDILINNAGSAWFGPTPELQPKMLDRMFAANVQAPYILTAALAPKMATKGRGVIINVSSVAATIGLEGAAAYAATKASLVAFTRSWAAEYGQHGIRVIAVAPGPVYTNAVDDSLTESLGATTPLGRAAQPNEIAETMVFLASAQAGYISGAVIPIDGGRAAV